MHFTLVKITPSGTDFAAANGFDDVILPLRHALARLGYNVETRVNECNAHSVNIMFGSCQIGRELDAFHPPANSVIFNLEQMTTPSPWHNDRYVEQLKRFTVWDYSHRNARYFRKSLGMDNVAEVRLGYVPEMTRLNRDFPQDIDVLFYGAVNERRQAILETLSRTKLRLGVLQGEYGTDRDYAIARSKLVLNVHYYVPATLEVPRLGYLWANHTAVVSELQKETERDPGLEECCRFCPYDELLPTVMEMALSDAARREQAEKAFAAFSRLRQEDFLEAVVGRRTHAAIPRRPAWLHAGSGKDFRPDCLNVDINPAMNADLTLDLSQPLDPSAKYSTVRFGEVSLKPGSFTRITAFELLEHVRELPTLMRNFLELLCDGGELHISVPYELSYGAWQDPTHVRTFNEKSLIYYSEWAWYLGWRDERFDLISLVFSTSPFADSLTAQGMALEEILRIPRAANGMNVVLRKRKSTPEEQEEHDRLTRSFYRGAIGEWSVR